MQNTHLRSAPPKGEGAGVFMQHLLGRGLLWGEVNSLALRAYCVGSRVGSGSQREPPGKAMWVQTAGSVATTSNHFKQLPQRGILQTSAWSLFPLPWPYLHIRCCILTASERDRNKSAPDNEASCLSPEWGEKWFRCPVTRDWRANPNGMWGPLAWGPWAFALWNNQVCSSLHRICPAPWSLALFPQESTSRRQICGENPSGGAVFKGAILRLSFQSTTSWHLVYLASSIDRANGFLVANHYDSNHCSLYFFKLQLSHEHTHNTHINSYLIFIHRKCLKMLPRKATLVKLTSLCYWTLCVWGRG